MNRYQINLYFKILAKRFPHACEIVLTGAAAGAIYGNVRATLDIDFAVRFKARSARQIKLRWREFEKATHDVTRLTGIVVQYAEDIDRWSTITFLDYWKHTRKFNQFGSIKVKLLDPLYWAIGKLTRYLDPDIRDMIQVFKKNGTAWRALAKVMGTALRKSPKSTACFLFRKQVEDFFAAYGKKIWGRHFMPEHAFAVFHRHAGIVLP